MDLLYFEKPGPTTSIETDIEIISMISLKAEIRAFRRQHGRMPLIYLKPDFLDFREGDCRLSRSPAFMQLIMPHITDCEYVTLGKDLLTFSDGYTLQVDRVMRLTLHR